MEATINNTIETLRNYHTEGPQTFDFSVSMVLAGNHNKELRRQIIYYITGKLQPISKCGMYAAADALKNYFNQPTLF